jgi:hypothetical protein
VAVVDDPTRGETYRELVEVARTALRTSVTPPTDVISTTEWMFSGPEDVVVVRVCGDEFSDCVQSLVCPPEFKTALDDFPVGNWVSIARMGSYYGDIGRVIAHQDKVIFVATLMRMRSEAQEFDVNYAPHMLRMPQAGLWPAPATATENIEVGGIECTQERDGLRRIFTKSGIRVMVYHPWELSMASPDGSPLKLTDRQARWFQEGLPSEYVESMPPVQTPHFPFLVGERVRLFDCAGLLLQQGIMLDEDTPAWRVYEEEGRAYCLVPAKRLIKEHTFEQVFYPALGENVDLISCDYFRCEAKIRRRGVASTTGNPMVQKLGCIRKLSGANDI